MLLLLKDDLLCRGFLKMGAVVGAFPADMGERCIHFFYEFCDMKTWFILFGKCFILMGNVTELNLQA